MSVPDPPWKKRVRPCPFYSAGRCLFSDSCNFLHEVKIKRPQEALQTHSINDAYDDENDAVPLLDHAVESRRYGSTFLPPTVTVHSPQSVHSSPRSPRTASLLMALEEVIGPDDTEMVQESITLVDESGTLRSKHKVQELDMSPESSEDSASGSDEGISAESFTSAFQHGHVAAEEDEDITERLVHTASHNEIVRQLPVVETSDLPDEGDDSANNSFDLLSPVDLSHGPPVPFPAGKRDDSMHREDSIDSGYADNWTGPTPFALSPPRQYRPKSTLDLLSSPFGSSYRVLSPKLPPSPQFLPPSPLQPKFDRSDSTADDVDDNVPTLFNVDPDEDDTIHPSSATTVKPSISTLSQPVESKRQDNRDVPKPANPSMTYPSPDLGNSSSDRSQHSDVAEERLASDLSTITEESSSWEESFSGSSFSSSEDIARERLAFPLPPPINKAELPGLNRTSVAEAIADILEESLEPLPQLSPRTMLANSFRFSKPPRAQARSRDRTSPPEVPVFVSPTPTMTTVRPRAISDLTIKAETNSVSPHSPTLSLHSEGEKGSPFVPQAESSVRSIDVLDVESMALESIGLAKANDSSSPISTQTPERVFMAANDDLERTHFADSSEDSGSFIARTLKRISLDIEALDQEQTGLTSADTDFGSYIQAQTHTWLAPDGTDDNPKDLRRTSNVSIFEVAIGSLSESSSPFGSHAPRLLETRNLEHTEFADTGDSFSPVMPQAPKRMSLNIEDLDPEPVENEVDFLGDMYQSYMSTPGSRRASLTSSRSDSASPHRRAAGSPVPTQSPISSDYHRFSSRSPSRYPSRAFAPSPALSEPLHPRVSSPLRDPPLSAASSSRITFVRSEQRVFTPPLSSVPPTRSTSPVLDLITSFQGQVSRPSSSSSKAKGKAKAIDDEVQLVDTPWQQASSASSSKVPLGWRDSLGKPSRPSSQASKRHRPTVLTNLPSASERLTPPVSGQSTPASNASTPIWLKPLRLSKVLEPASAPLPSRPSSELIFFHHRPAPSISSSSTVSSRQSLSQHPLLSSVPSSAIPDHVRYTPIDSHDNNSPALSVHSSSRASFQALPQSAPISHSQSWRNSQLSTASSRNSLIESKYPRTSSRLSEPIHGIAEEGESFHDDEDDTVRNPIPHTAPPTRPSSVLPSPVHAIATPKPDLIFAIASDDVEEVRRVLESGEAGPNDMVGPQAPLAFALTNDRLKHKVDIVKALLAYGAEPTALNNPNFNPPKQGTASNRSSMVGTPPPSTGSEVMDPATRYYIERANAGHTRKTSALIHRSFFRPLTRVRYDIIGQDHVFEQLFKVLSAHSRQRTVTPIVVVLCGPSGHGKSLLARKFGALLEVPTHTVNMTTLRSAHDLWDSYSMSPYEEATTCTLAEFLLENEGKRCVVVLDEIEKTEDPKALYPLLMPWEIGRCSPHAGDRHIDVRNVVWLGTSNIGHDVVFEYQDGLSDPTPPMSQAEYLKLVALIRPTVSERLGASLLSRVTAVLPFVSFTENEKMAIATEALHSLGGDGISSLQPELVESTAREALAGYQPAEGARSLYRAVSSLLLDLIIPNDE